jgi:polyphosphate:AMP phosphotransferase
MFESLDIEQRIDKVQFDAAEPELREQLIEAQLSFLEAEQAPIIVILSGMDVIGRSECGKQLLSWLDARHVRPFATILPGEEGLERPRMWRFWDALPRDGRMGLFLNSWYEGPISDYVLGRIDREQYRARIDEMVHFERMLAHEDALILKFMLFLSEEQTLDSLKKFKRKRLGAWKVSRHEVEISKEFANRFDECLEMLEDLVSATSTHYAPWIPVASTDARFRDLTVGQAISAAMQRRLEAGAPVEPISVDTSVVRTSELHANILDTLDLDQTLSEKQYKRELKKEQRRLTKLTLGKKFERHSVVAVFEGNDAAGKGGSIRRVVQALDPRLYRVIPIAAPSDEERAHGYLWRFWRHVPTQGHVTIFDRSWYGRVLVERVEGFCSEADWSRAYEEIRNFESELTDYGVIVVKFWLAIDQQEQLQRFQEREETGYKRYKITEEDWRNREKWGDYARAVHDMVDRTSTSEAPWTLVEATDKYFARVKVLKTINDRLEAELD